MSGQGDLAATFRLFAQREATPTSPLYAALARAVADDPVLLALSDRARPGQPRPNMLLAAVHALLLAGEGPELAAHYAGLAGDPAPPEAAFPHFRAFCMARHESLAALLAQRSVGTNEVARCAVIRAGMAEVLARTEGPLHVVEVGASAGLLLLWNRIAVDYGPGMAAGPADAALRLACPARGAPPPLAVPDGRIASQCGLDLDPMSLESEADRRWLQALVWPEHRERRARLTTAIEAARRAGIAVRRGDAVADMPGLLAALPPGETACVFHAFTFNQIPPPLAARFAEALAQASRARPVLRLAFEWGEGDAPGLTLTPFDEGRAGVPRHLAAAEAHGRWIAWNADGAPAAEHHASSAPDPGPGTPERQERP